MSQYFELKEKTEHGTERDPVWYVEFDMKKRDPGPVRFTSTGTGIPNARSCMWKKERLSWSTI